jgi:uracil-DNA glycosylase
VAKAFRILSGDLSALKGPKVEAFAAAIRGDLSHVVIDAWAARAARSNAENVAKLFRSDEMPGTRERRAMAEGYRRAAVARGIEPAAMQAAVWVAIRESGVHAKPPKDERGAARWYGRQNRARVAQGLAIITGDYAWQNAPRGQAAALKAATA